MSNEAKKYAAEARAAWDSPGLELHLTVRSLLAAVEALVADAEERGSAYDGVIALMGQRIEALEDRADRIAPALTEWENRLAALEARAAPAVSERIEALERAVALLTTRVPPACGASTTTHGIPQVEFVCERERGHTGEHNEGSAYWTDASTAPVPTRTAPVAPSRMEQVFARVQQTHAEMRARGEGVPSMLCAAPVAPSACGEDCVGTCELADDWHKPMLDIDEPHVRGEACIQWRCSGTGPAHKQATAAPAVPTTGRLVTCAVWRHGAASDLVHLDNADCQDPVLAAPPAPAFVVSDRERFTALAWNGSGTSDTHILARLVVRLAAHAGVRLDGEEQR